MSLSDCMESCWQVCCSCCKWFVSKKEKESYPNVRYNQLQQTNVGATPVLSEDMAIHEIPLEKIFSFPQGQREYRVHPQISHVPQPITDQPRTELIEESSAQGVFQFPKAPQTALQKIEEEASDREESSSGSKERLKLFRKRSARRKRSREGDRFYTMSTDSVPQVEETLQEGDPSLEFSLYFDVHRRTLTVYLQRAHNLPFEAQHSTFVSSVVISLLPEWEEAFETEMAINTLDPVYNETFDFPGIAIEEIQAKVLVFRIYHHISSVSDQMIGMVYFPLRLADLFCNTTVTRKISKRKELQKALSRGELLLSLKYNPHHETLKVTVYKVANLHNPHLLSIRDPYVKVILMYQGTRLHTWKTQAHGATQTFTIDRYFNHDVSQLDLSSIALDVSVKFSMDYGVFHRKKTLGVATIGPNAEEEHGRHHWAQMIECAGEEVSVWHPLHSPSAVQTAQ